MSQAPPSWAQRPRGDGSVASASTAGVGSAASTVRRSRRRSSKTWSSFRSTVDAAPAMPHWVLDSRLIWSRTGFSTISGSTTPAASTSWRMSTTGSTLVARSGVPAMAEMNRARAMDATPARATTTMSSPGAQPRRTASAGPSCRAVARATSTTAWAVVSTPSTRAFDTT